MQLALRRIIYTESFHFNNEAANESTLYSIILLQPPGFRSMHQFPQFYSHHECPNRHLVQYEGNYLIRQIYRGANCRPMLLVCHRPLDQIRAELSPQELAAIERQVGNHVAAMHTLKNETFGYFGAGPGSGSATWRQAFMAMIYTLLADGESLGADIHTDR